MLNLKLKFENVEKCLTDLYQTYSVDELWDRKEHFRFWSQKPKGQGHSGIKYAVKVSFLVISLFILAGLYFYIIDIRTKIGFVPVSKNGATNGTQYAG